MDLNNRLCCMMVQVVYNMVLADKLELVGKLVLVDKLALEHKSQIMIKGRKYRRLLLLH
jgi:hypothetical protein